MWRGARSIVQRGERVPPLVCSVGCFRTGLKRAALAKNCSVDGVIRGDRRGVFAQRCPLRSDSLPLHRTVFHPCRYCFLSLWPRALAAWTIGMEVDRRGNNHWSLCPHLHPRTVARSVSARERNGGLTKRCSQRLDRGMFSMSILISVIQPAAHLRLPEPWLSLCLVRRQDRISLGLTNESSR